VSYEVYAGDEALGQFASNKGYHDLIAAAKGYPSLAQMFDHGETGDARACAAELQELADEVDDKDVRETALGLAKMIRGKDNVVLTDGVIADDDEGDAEKSDGGPDLPEDLSSLPAEGREIFRTVLKLYEGTANETLAYVRAYRALEDAGYDLTKSDPTLADVHVDKPIGDDEEEDDEDEEDQIEVEEVKQPKARYLPPVEVGRAAKRAWDLGVSVDGITEPLAKGEGITLADVQQIADHFADVKKGSEPDDACDAWGGLYAERWAQRVFKKAAADIKKYSEDQPRDDHGRFGSGGDSPEEQKKFATERLIKDGPREGTSRVRVVKDPNIGIWGESHSGSSTITGHSAEAMGIEGYRKYDASPAARALGDKFLNVIAEGRGAGEPLYHGFNNTQGIKWEEGATVRLPLTATSGDKDSSMSYGINYARSDAENKSTVFEFPSHTPIAGYSRWDRENTKELGHTWSEAIVAGEFRVTGTRTEREAGYRELPVTVVTLEHTGTFDPSTKEWVKKTETDNDLSEAVGRCKGHQVPSHPSSAESGDEVEKAGNGVMLAFWPDAETQKELAVEGGEAADEIHLTLAYFGKDVDSQALDMLDHWLQGFATSHAPVKGTITGIGVFPATPQSDGKDVAYRGFHSPGIQDFRRELVEAAAAAGCKAKTDHGYNPHLTLKYIAPAAPHLLPHPDDINVTFDKVVLSVGDKKTEYELTGTLASHIAAKYDPDQPRDEHGRFGEGGAESVPEGHRDHASARDPAGLVNVKTFNRGEMKGDKVPSPISAVTPAEKSSLGEYKTFGFAKVNAYLCTGKAANENVKPMAKDVAAVMKRSTLAEDTTVYRGVNGPLAEKLGALSVGDSGKLPCYQSTTTSMNLAKDFASGKLGEAARTSSTATSPTVLHLDVQRGYGAIPVAKMSGYSDTERELLLNKGGSFRVTDKSVVDGVTHIRMAVTK
jgi:2'-5' RNA ligase